MNLGLTTKGFYYDCESSNIVYGYAVPTVSGRIFIHISPGVVRGDLTQFTAVTGHELIHAYHYITLGNNFNKILSESVAYDFSYNIFLNSGDLINAWKILNIQILHGYFKGITPNYEVPFKFLFK